MKKRLAWALAATLMSAGLAMADKPSGLDGTSWKIDVSPDGMAKEKGEKDFHETLTFADGKLVTNEGPKLGFESAAYSMTRSGDNDWGFTAERRSLLTALSMVGAIIGGITFGYYSDRIGRRRAIVVALVLALLIIPLWAFSKTLPLLVVGAFLMQFMVQGAWGIIPAHINELSPDSVRGFLPGFAYQCGVLCASAVVYIEALFAERMTYAKAMSFTAATVFTLAAIAAWLGRERRGVVFGEVVSPGG